MAKKKATKKAAKTKAPAKASGLPTRQKSSPGKRCRTFGYVSDDEWETFKAKAEKANKTLTLWMLDILRAAK